MPKKTHSPQYIHGNRRQFLIGHFLQHQFNSHTQLLLMTSYDDIMQYMSVFQTFPSVYLMYIPGQCSEGRYEWEWAGLVGCQGQSYPVGVAIEVKEGGEHH